MEKVDHSLKGIYQQYADRLYSYGLQICPDKGLVEDALHEVFLDIHRNMEAFSKAENPRNYLFASLRYKLYKMKKGRTGRIDLSQVNVPEIGTIEEKIIGEEQLRMQESLAREMISCLTDRQREILFLRFVERMSFQEISEHLSIERQSAQNLFGRAVGKLRRIFLSETVEKSR